MSRTSKIGFLPIPIDKRSDFATVSMYLSEIMDRFGSCPVCGSFYMLHWTMVADEPDRLGTMITECLECGAADYQPPCGCEG